MAGNVLSWGVAIKKGFEPRLYPFSSENIPLGEYKAMLDFKIWAKKLMAINCYFTQSDAAKKFQLTVYCRQKGLYKIKDCPINFAECPTNILYWIKVLADEKKKITFVDASLL